MKARQTRPIPIALTIAGSDSGGGAGLQADLKTFAAVGVYGTTVITCVTAQNPRRVLAIQAVRPDWVRRQLEAVFAELRPQAVKTGMLLSPGIIEAVADFFARQPRIPLIVDPVMVATSGARLLRPSAGRVLRERLFPLATLITPNLEEAERLTGLTLREPEDMRAAARELVRTHGCAALVKGGHLPAGRQAIDIYNDGRTELLLTAPRLRNVSLHGTGCTYSAAIAGYCARGCPLTEAVSRAKAYIARAIARHRTAGSHAVMDHRTGAR